MRLRHRRSLYVSWYVVLLRREPIYVVTQAHTCWSLLVADVHINYSDALTFSQPCFLDRCIMFILCCVGWYDATSSLWRHGNLAAKAMLHTDAVCWFSTLYNDVACEGNHNIGTTS
jgi:hypothetical protein